MKPKPSYILKRAKHKLLMKHHPDLHPVEDRPHQNKVTACVLHVLDWYKQTFVLNEDDEAELERVHRLLTDDNTEPKE